MKKLHIGCGYDKKEGFVNIDISKKVNPDMVVNIERGLPFEDNTFEYIYSKNALEEIKPQNWEFVLKEINRVAKPGCILELVLSFDNLYERIRINHYRTFSWDSFYMCGEDKTHNYTSPIILRNLKKRPNVFVRFGYSIFPFLKKSVHFKFEIIKNKNQK